MVNQSEISWFDAVMTFLNYAILTVFGFAEEYWAKLWGVSLHQDEKVKQGFQPLLRDMDDFFTRRIFHRLHDCLARPIKSSPGCWIDILDRQWEPDPKKWKKHTSRWTLSLTGTSHRCLNLSSYNYLGFGDNEAYCNNDVINVLQHYGSSMSGSRMESGYTEKHRELEKMLAHFVGHEDAMVYGMGFATNTTSIPALVGKGDLIISDSLNHASIAIGSRGSGAKIKVFRHDNMKHLEKVIRESISEGQPRTHRPWKRIIIIVEGVYSMEGDIVSLPDIVKLKKKYKCYLYVDEAHSIGALGAGGHGVCEYWGVNPKDVDVLMGTFSKSFAAAGGYVAGSAALIKHLRHISWGEVYANNISPPVAQQIISTMRVIAGEDGSDIGKTKIKQLRDNAIFFRRRLKELGFQVYGNFDSPVIPVMIYHPAKAGAFSQECLKRNIAVCIAGYPATPILETRARFCISAAHTHEHLEAALQVIDEVGDLVVMKYRKGSIAKSIDSKHD